MIKNEDGRHARGDRARIAGVEIGCIFRRVVIT